MAVNVGAFGNEALQFAANFRDLFQFAFLESVSEGTASSAFTSEDAGSNVMGAWFGQHLSIGPGAPKLSAQLQTFFSSAGAVAPTAAPNWSSLAFNEEEHEESFQLHTWFFLRGFLVAGFLQ